MQTYRGSCHCGTVKFEADADLSAGTLRCNCSICFKSRAWLLAIPGTALRFTAGEQTLKEYRFGPHRIQHLFCPNCGVKVCGRVPGEKPGEGFAAVSVSCLDDVTPAELAAAPIHYVDGKNDEFKKPPAVTAYL